MDNNLNQPDTMITTTTTQTLAEGRRRNNGAFLLGEMELWSNIFTPELQATINAAHPQP